MSAKPIPLTKTRFVMALECPRKLDYARDLRYSDTRAHDEFLKSLAEGGHQVGELARRMFPGGQLIVERSADDQVRATHALLSQPDATIFEATIRHGNLLVRCDVLRKTGNQVQLLEVKGKGFHWRKDRFLSSKKGGHPVLSGWRPSLYDIAYQAYVLELAYPEFKISPSLLLLDKTVSVSIQGLNPLLSVSTEGRRVTVSVHPKFDIATLNPPVLRQFDVSEPIACLRQHPIEALGREQGFEEFVADVSTALERGESLPRNVGAGCKTCQYYVEPADVTSEQRSGWGECMEQHTGKSPGVGRPETVFALHRLHPTRLEEMLRSQPIDLRSVADAALPEGPCREAISLDQRRRMQWLEARGDLDEPFVLSGPLKSALEEWQWPLHFIDFETSRPALPYHAGRTPYDQILFQFSHHVLQRDGTLEHRTQFLEGAAGVAPSIPVLRELRKALSPDNGTVLHWWTHEGTVLKEIKEQIQLDKPSDAAELIDFVDSMVGSENGVGRLIDLGRLVSKTAFFPGTCGSSSIKRVLPRVLAHSESLRSRYSARIYGSLDIPSLNFNNWQWVVTTDGGTRDPYSLLDPLFADEALQALVADAEDEDSGYESTFVNNGGAAIIAYDQLQQPDLAESERRRLTDQLLRYCELDTLAMVMVYQALTGHGLRVAGRNSLI